MRHPHACHSREHLLSRRQILGAGAAGALSFLSPALAAEVQRKRKQVIFIWLDGGISQLESWDPKPNTQFGGPFRTIPTSVPGVHFSELLPHTAKQMHRLSVVRGMHTQDDAHSSGVERIERGDPKNRGAAYPYFGSAVAEFLGPGPSKLPPYVWIKPYNGGFKYNHAGFLGAGRSMGRWRWGMGSRRTISCGLPSCRRRRMRGGTSCGRRRTSGSCATGGSRRTTRTPTHMTWRPN
jgi:hypothetical protein